MKELQYTNHNEIKLCRGKGCCPRMKRMASGQVLITDDDGNKVVLTTEQAQLIPQALAQLDTDSSKENIENKALLEEKTEA